MNTITGKIALVTGASAGIGEATARLLAQKGCNLILLARRIERLEELKKSLSSFGVSITLYQADVRDRRRVAEIATEVKEKNLIPDILVNNAGLSRGLQKLYEGSYEDWDDMIDTNIKGLLNITREILPLMVQRNQGHVINLGSVAGHTVYPGGNVYNATKFAEKALSEAMNVDLVGTNIKITSIDPGAVETEFSTVRFRGNKLQAQKVYEGYHPLVAEDIADAILYVLQTPLHVNITTLIIQPLANRNLYVKHRQ